MHPGEYLALSYVEPYKISPAELANCLGLPLADVEQLLAQEMDLTAATAVRLELALDRSAASWMTMQADYSLMQARRTIDPTSVRPLVLPARVDAA
jgi:addiction module HigA family antidote